MRISDNSLREGPARILRPVAVLLLTMAFAAVLAVGLLGLTGTKPAQAAFPGENGKIAFTSTRDFNAEIYVMNADGSGQTNLTNNPADEGLPAFSPDGTKIAFESNRDRRFNPGIYVMNADGSGQTRLTGRSGVSDSDPAFSPDGKIAFTRYACNFDPVEQICTGNQEIYVMNADGSGQTNLTNNSASEGNPAFSPDGTKIAFGRDGDVYVMNADGSGQTKLTDNAAVDFSPAFSPDGSKIAFTSTRGDNGITGSGNYDVYVMNADGSEQTRLTDNPYIDAFPAFSPDGSKITFETQRDVYTQIYVMNADGSGQTNLTTKNDTTAENTQPEWGIAVETNAPPEAQDDSYATDEDIELNVLAPGVLGNDTDAEDDTLKTAKVGDPSNGTLTLNEDGSFTYEPNANFDGTDTFTYKASDGKGGEVTATVTITVNAANDPPDAENDSVTTPEDTPVDIPVLGNDSDPDSGDTLTVTDVSDPSHGTATINDADSTVEYEPDANYNGTDSFTYTISDGQGGKDTATVNVEVTPATDAPVANDDAYSVDEDQTLTVDAPGVLLNDPDADGDDLEAVLESDPSNGTLTLNEDGSFTYQPDKDFNGEDSFTYKANDGTNDSNTATVTITVKPVEDCTISGTEGRDFLQDTSGDDVICAKGGDDIILATKGGNDVVHGDGGKDTVLGTKGKTTLKGGEGDDILLKLDRVSGNDTLDGEGGNDFCLADKGDKISNCERGSSTSSLSAQERQRLDVAKQKAAGAR